MAARGQLETSSRAVLGTALKFLIVHGLENARKKEKRENDRYQNEYQIFGFEECESTARKLSNILLIVGGEARRSNGMKFSKKSFLVSWILIQVFSTIFFRSVHDVCKRKNYEN